MNQKMEEMQQVLTLILNNFGEAVSLLEQQNDDIKKYNKQNSADLDSNIALIAELKSTKTSLELLRDEIEELHQVIAALYKGKHE